MHAITYAFHAPVSFATIARPVAKRVFTTEGTAEDRAWVAHPGLHPTGLMRDYPPLL